MKEPKTLKSRTEGTLMGAVQILHESGYTRAEIIALVDLAIQEAAAP